MSSFRQIGTHRSDAQRSTDSPNEAVNNVERSSTTSTTMRLPFPIQQSQLKMRPIKAASMRNLEQAQTSSITSRDRTSDWRSYRLAPSIASSATSQCFSARLAGSCSRRSASSAHTAGTAGAALNGSALKKELPAFSRDALNGGRLTLAIRWPNWRRPVTIAKKLLWSILLWGRGSSSANNFGGISRHDCLRISVSRNDHTARITAACPISTPGPTKTRAAIKHSPTILIGALTNGNVPSR